MALVFPLDPPMTAVSTSLSFKKGLIGCVYKLTFNSVAEATLECARGVGAMLWLCYDQVPADPALHQSCEYCRRQIRSQAGNS